MARTKQQINQEIIDAIASEPSLAGLTSTSQVSIWSQFKDAIVSVLQINDQLADLQEVRFNKIADEAVPGTPSWLQRQVLKFQYGDQINLNTDLTFSYTTVDKTKQIVTRCSIQQLDDTRQVLVKVAKGQTVLAPLTNGELTALTAYINMIKFAGIHTVPISLQADRIVSNIEIYYSGEYIQSTVKTACISAINAFLAALPFDGTLYLSKLEDAIQAVPGVVDVVLRDIVARPASTLITDPGLLPIDRTYNAQAGYIIAETAAGSTLNDTLIMNVVV